MLILKKLKSLIKSQDINGNVVNFNFSKDSNKHKSFCGGFLSIIFVIGLLFFGLTKFVQMINYDNITRWKLKTEFFIWIFLAIIFFYTCRRQEYSILSPEGLPMPNSAVY